MTRKDYELIAEAIRDTRTKGIPGLGPYVVNEVLDNAAMLLGLSLGRHQSPVRPRPLPQSLGGFRMTDTAAAIASANQVCAIDGPCRCPTCGIVEVLLHGKLVALGFTRNEAERVSVSASTGIHPALASVRVDGAEVYRIEREPDEALHPDVLSDIINRLKE